MAQLLFGTPRNIQTTLESRDRVDTSMQEIDNFSGASNILNRTPEGANNILKLR